jgi:hypothetical protein
VESFAFLAEYYTSLGYYNSVLNNYDIPSDAFLTVSVSLRHILWCEKDKKFLSSYVSPPLYSIAPPLRSPADLRVIQQAARSGLISTIEIFSEDVDFISEVFEKQILSVFQAVQLFSYRWSKYGFL